MPGNQAACNKVFHIALKRVTILNLPVLSLKPIIRKSHIPRIANDIDYFSISRVKILVRLYNSWPRCTFESAIGLRRGVRNQLLNICKGDRVGGANEICNQESGPRVS